MYWAPDLIFQLWNSIYYISKSTNDTANDNELTLPCGNRINTVQNSKYHGCLCTGSLRRQGIRSHDIGYVE